MKKRSLYTIIGLLVVGVIVLLVLKSKGVIGGSDAVKVAVDTATYRDITQVVTASGKIYPETEVRVSSDVSGEIVDLPVQEGDSVHRGQVVARVYADIYSSIVQQQQAILKQAEAQYANAKAALGSYKAQLDQAKYTYERDKQLLQQKVIAQSEFEQAESAYYSALANYEAAQQQVRSAEYAVQSAKANLSQAQDNLRRTTITAPMDGIVSVLDVKKGERVVGTAQMAGTEIMRIADMNVMEVRVDVGENDIPKVQLGDTAIIEVDAYNDRKFKGYVTQVAPSSQAVAQQTSTAATLSSSADQVANYTVHIRILRSSYADLFDPKRPRFFPLRPGMSASVNIQTETRHHVLAVPINAVALRNISSKKNQNNATLTNSTDQQEVVFKLTGQNLVRMVPVKTGIQDDNYIQIESGLNAGDVVVSAPYNAVSKTLNDSTKVKVVPHQQLFEVTTTAPK
ncbi:HlyD family secretion protein [Thermoflavifilum aggregans]|mgnify:CR=1 FL=1|uniref:HlyD family secretion protein n=1 Tax=Thermoflavifilum aggregans TaxID=454188 RepID=A0A2M9CRS3_9BACT|nr:efflux RND transporter periplasmic adaptor subunit [Thermoflavifilum aggregans]PJJ74632.1 HlyD family secretion protein [Thermoflavifilum aggregans]